MINKYGFKKFISQFITFIMVFSIVIGQLSLTFAESDPSSQTIGKENTENIQEELYDPDIKNLQSYTPQHYKASIPYNKGEYVYNTLTITGSAIGKEIVLSVKDIEELSETTDIGYEGYYSTLTSGEIWNCNKMNGVDLYKLLILLGMKENLPDTTPIKITAKDGHSPGTITLREIKNIEQYGYYASKEAKEPVKTDLPVLIAYASNGYPLVGPTGNESYSKKFNKEEGYVEEADNSGGPLRLLFGQKYALEYNAPKSSKFVDKIVVGDNISYTHHTDDLRESLLKVKLFNGNPSNNIKTIEFKVSEIEDMVYKNKTSKVCNYYPINGDFYEGIDIWYLLRDKVGLIGTEGKISFYKDNSLITDINMDYIRNPGGDYESYYTIKDGKKIHWVKPAIAYAKNGEPIVKENEGPLAITLPQHNKFISDGLIAACDEIHVLVKDDSYGHHIEPYKGWENETLNISGSGVRKNTIFTIEEIEQQLDFIRKGNYYLKKDEGKDEIAEFIGVDLDALLNSRKVGLKVNADRVIIKSINGGNIEFSLDEVKKSDYLNSKDKSKGLKILLAYGKNGFPLVPNSKDIGYNVNAKNSGGPLFLVVGQKDAEDKNYMRCLSQIKEIEVTASDESWKHDRAPYDQYLDTTRIKITGSEVKEPRIFTLRQLEAMTDGIIRDSFASSGGDGNYEGVILRYLLDQVELKDGIDKPSKIKAYAGPEFSSELSVEDVYKEIDSNYQPGEKRDVILAYAKDGYPLVPNKEDEGFIESTENHSGPVRVIVENSINQWVKYVDEIILGDGEYEEPKLKSKYTVKHLQLKVRDQDEDIELEEPQVFSGNIGDIVTVKALDIPGWIPDAQTKKLTLKEGENEIDFRYSLNIGLLITGKDVSKDIYYNRFELEAMADDERNLIRNYSVMKRGGVPAIIMGKGIDLVSLMEKANIVEEENLDVLCRATDGWLGAPVTYDANTKSFTIDRYFYPDIFNKEESGKELVLPMLVFYKVEDEKKVPEIPSKKDDWDKTMNFPNPTLMIGQSHINDFNNQNFAKMIYSIEIGGTEGKEVLTIRGEEIEKSKTYRLDAILAKGFENKIFGSNKREGISLRRILSDIDIEENCKIQIQTGKEGNAATINSEDAKNFLLGINVKDNIIDRESPLCIYYEKDGMEAVIENVTEMICGKDNESENPNIPGKPGGNRPKPRPIPEPSQSGTGSSKGGSSTVSNKENVLSGDNLKTFDFGKYFEHEQLKDKNGQQIEKIIVTSEGLKQLEEISKGDLILINEEKDIKNIQLILNEEFIRKAQEKELMIRLNTSVGNYVLPMTEFNMDQIAEKLGCQKDEIMMNVTIALANNEIQKKMKDMLSKGQNMLTELVDFNIKFTFADKEIPYTSFENYICHEIVLSDSNDPATGVYLDKTNQKIVPMPTIMVQKEGKEIARIYGKNNRLYAVIFVEKNFEDMIDHWAKKEVDLLASKMILKGRTDIKFDPESNITRAEFIAMITRALGLTDEKIAMNLSDVQGEEWFAGSAGAAIKEKIISSAANGTINPNHHIRRSEMANMIVNALKVVGEQKRLSKEEINSILKRFKDKEEMSDEEKESIALAVEMNIMDGKSDGKFAPQDYETRAKAAVMIAKLLKVTDFIDTNNQSNEETNKENQKELDKSSRRSRSSDRSDSSDSNVLPDDTKNMIVVEGSAVKIPRAFSLSDLKNMNDGKVTATYFSRGRDTRPNPRAHTKFTGISVYYLLTEEIELNSAPSRITVIGEDGYRQSFPIKEVAGYYMDETDPDNNELEMIIAWEEDGSKYSTSEGAPFRLVMGQRFSEEYNRLRWIRNVAKIEIE